MKRIIALSMALGIAGLGCAAYAQNILAGKPVHTLGEAKTWSAGEQSYTFITADLEKLVAVPTNTDNVFLYPENGELNTPENQAIGIQGFYVDMEQSTGVMTVTTTWEGAAADAYDIWLTDEVPTTDILGTEPTYSAQGLGQYTTNTATLPSGSQGRYLVFQPTAPTNYAWGVKIRSISAMAPAEQVLTSFNVSPQFFIEGVASDVQLTVKDQFGLDVTDVTYTVEGGSIDNGKLTVNGSSAVVTATAGEVSLSQTVYGVSAPDAPLADNIALPIFTNTDTRYNGTAGFIVAYNGGAKEYGRMTFGNGDVAAAFGNTRCVFVYNNSAEVMGGWDVDINPVERGLGKFHIDIFGTKDVEGNIVFERTATIGDNHPISIKAGEWNSFDVDVHNETVLHTLSVRFDEANASDIVMANIYFSPYVDETDETVPVLGDVTVEADARSAVFTMSATDDASTLHYVVTVDGRQFTAAGAPGETVSIRVTGLTPDTHYNAEVVVSDSKNSTEPRVVEFKTEEVSGDGVTFSGTEKGVCTQEGNDYEFTVSYTIVYNADGTLTVSAKYEWANGEPFGMVNGDLFINNIPKGLAMENGVRSLTTTETFVEGETVNLEFYIPGGAGCIARTPISYVVGSVSSDPSAIGEINETEVADNCYYDLLGRKVANPGRGFYIHNGRKVFVR